MTRYKSTAPRKPKKSKVLIFLNIVIGILSAAVVFGLIGFFMSSGDNYYNRKFGDSSVSRDIENGEYADLLDMYYRDWGVLGMVNSGYEESAAVAKYAQAYGRGGLRGRHLRAGDQPDQRDPESRPDRAVSKSQQRTGRRPAVF